MIPDELRQRLARDRRLMLTIKAVPKASKNEIVGLMDDGSLKVKITAAAEKGKANAAICEFLAAEFAVPKRNVSIVRGETSHTKQVQISC